MNESFTADEREAQERVQQKWRELQGKDPWAVLGVEREAGEARLKQAYFDLARRFHSDAFVGLRLGAAKEKLDEVFSRVAEAYETLSDPDKRAELVARRALEDAGTSTDVGALLDAEQDFTRGRGLLERGDNTAAGRLFESAARADSSNLEWKAPALFCAFWPQRDPAEAKRRSTELEQLAKQAPQLPDILYFSGRLALEGGDEERAQHLLRRVLREQPSHAMAARDQRLLLKRRE